MPKTRTLGTRKAKPRILILCEGQKTEPKYFTGLINDTQYGNLTSVKVEIYDVKINTAKELIREGIRRKKEAAQERNPLHEIWIVFDKDGYTKHPESFDQAAANGINIAFSSISFEYWVLLHFTYTTRPFSNCESLINFLKKNGIPNYKKRDDIYNLVKEHTCRAIYHANKSRSLSADLKKGTPPFNLNPYTNVDNLVCRLIHFDDLKDNDGNYLKIPSNTWNIELEQLIAL